ncbi:uncharacterized protein MJAP1_001221 [Malassezia japonica]|uniref:Very-long-chain 3-oxoacyl-CoA reductase n=1 Tax=Malassezia japonica TaxID=223818 RepID=A0AAF0F4J7_9BASI|nr:uncharacterized protein MJAP1_001221 [Malassezia japonica]WFD38272.1 hypothetical protein MJAP1_001221 [Malassezia japonica]
MVCPCLLSFAVVGIAVVALAALYFAYLVLEIHVLPGKKLTRYGANAKMRGAGAWALVTGATDGIGKEFALQLAAAGFNIVLVSRTQEKLMALGREIEGKYVGTKTTYYAMDFASAGPAEYEGLERTISHLDVSVLVNNVGASHDMPVSFVEMAEAEMDRIVDVNVIATQRVTKLVAPRLVRRKGGLILNLGSFTGQWGTPMMATYAGTKAFLIGWTQALGEEMRRANVDVQLLNTYFVVSSMSKVRRASAMIPLPTQYVAAALGRIGRSTGALGRPFTLTPWPAHAWLDWATARVVPAGLLLRKSYDVNVATRRAAIRKAERLAKAQ